MSFHDSGVTSNQGASLESIVQGRRVISKSDPTRVALLKFALCRKPMRFRVGKLDADAMGALANLGAVPHFDEIIIVNGLAAYEERMDPNIICIECGDGGPNCHDHHSYAAEPGASSETAEAVTLQTDREACFLDASQRRTRDLLNRYLHNLDAGEFHLLRCEGQKGVYPALIHLISGMQECTTDPIGQYSAFLKIRQAVLDTGLNPFIHGVEMLYSVLEEAGEDPQGWIRAKERLNLDLKLEERQFFRTKGGLDLGIIVTNLMGAPREMQNSLVPGTQKKCDIVIALSPEFRLPDGVNTVRKFTITTPKDRDEGVLSLEALGPALDRIETERYANPGWGSPRPKIEGALPNFTMVCSPLERGSFLPLEDVKRIIEELY